MRNIVIGIEGTVGAGKTSICRELLKQIENSIILHGGEIYRAIVYGMMKNKIENTEKLDAFEIMKRLGIEIKIENKETFAVYFGFKECPWCRSVIESLIEVSSDLGLEEIYYVDVKDIRDTMKVNDDGKVETDKKGTSGYYKLLKLLDNVLDDYTLTNKDNEGVSANEKRIYAPTVISIVDGKVEDMTTGISDAQTDAYMKLTDEMKKETYNKFKCVLECVTENKNSCSIDKKC